MCANQWIDFEDPGPQVTGLQRYPRLGPWGYRLHHRTIPTLYRVFHPYNTNYQRNFHSELLDSIEYCGRTLYADDFSFIAQGTPIHIPPGFALILACVSPNHYTIWVTVGATNLRRYKIPTFTTPVRCFFIVIRWNSSSSARVRLQNRAYIDNMLNHHFPHRTRSEVRASRKKRSLRITNQLKFKFGTVNFSYY